MSSKGIIYTIATPIGNLEDITLRAIRILSEVDMILAEDTRVTLRLLNHLQIKKHLISLNRINERHRIPSLIEQLHEGKNMALVSDAGTPLLSDPGRILIEAALDVHISVIPVPGASAVSGILQASKLVSNSFIFFGFLPRKKSHKKKLLDQFPDRTIPFIIFESPFRIKKTLKELYEILGDRTITIGREMTKMHEEYLHTTLQNAINNFEERNKIQGEFTLIIA